MVDAAEWTVDSVNGELVVSNARERLATFERVSTGVRGSVRAVDDGAVVIDLDSNGA
jgi:hypothetical protein